MLRPESSFSEAARPPVKLEEAQDAPDAVCTQHNGLIASAPTESDTPGKVFWCPIGRQYWRYQPNSEPGFRGRLAYQRVGTV